MVGFTDARGRAALITTCLSVALGATLAAPTVGAEVEPPTAPAAAEVIPAALAEPWVGTRLEGASAIAGGRGTFVAVGGTGQPEYAAAWTSRDGLVWELAEVSDAPTGSHLSQVVATIDGFVALGVESGRHGSVKERVLAWHSSDGQTWERAVVERPAKSGLEAVASALADGPAGQLALGSFIGQDLGGQRLWHSVDGREWQPAKLPKVKDPVWGAVVAYPKGYLLLGQSGKGKTSNWKSTDGTTWKRLADMPRLFDIAVDDEGGLAGIGWKHIYEAQSGLRSWEKVMKRPDSWQAGGSNAFAFVEWDGSEFVVPGFDLSGCDAATEACHRNPLLVSADGTTWSEAAGPDGLQGADEATWFTDVASLDGSTVVLGEHVGETVVWLASTGPTGA